MERCWFIARHPEFVTQTLLVIRVDGKVKSEFQ